MVLFITSALGDLHGYTCRSWSFGKECFEFVYGMKQRGTQDEAIPVLRENAQGKL